ncbi:NYN domain protein [Thalassobacter stenotrophicus]|uniref:NYN domain protein n=3 Tax=Thalassobacter stenotrophicus TaxID=266809 RepID=A0A0P1EY63_9RHOB|nr:NYN domain protein [Thalassobacter stenotrophicus]SHJ20089.1 Uncharacterized conserved protein, LabA/DUF88 family [Thalassobacter stenotrophicus DSM 16310]
MQRGMSAFVVTCVNCRGAGSINAVKLSWLGHDLAAMRRDGDCMNMLNQIHSTRVAVFVDGDNVPPKLIDPVLERAKHLGRVDAVRVYADECHVEGWCKTPGITLAPMASSKNASDIALCLDALELALSSDIATFVIASADQGFAHLAQRLRTHGKWVLGVSGGKPSDFFQNSCSEFHRLPMGPNEAALDALHSKIAGVLGQTPTKPISLANFGHEMYQLGVTTSDLPNANWRSFLAGHADRYTLCPIGVRLSGDLTGQQWLNRRANPGTGRQ